MVELQPLGRLGQRVHTISDTRDWRHTAFSSRSCNLCARGEAPTRRCYSGLRGRGISCRGASDDIQGGSFHIESAPHRQRRFGFVAASLRWIQAMGRFQNRAANFGVRREPLVASSD